MTENNLNKNIPGHHTQGSFVGSEFLQAFPIREGFFIPVFFQALTGPTREGEITTCHTFNTRLQTERAMFYRLTTRDLKKILAGETTPGDRQERMGMA